MVGGNQRSSPDAPNGEACDRMCTRRHYVALSAAFAVVSGCLGTDDTEDRSDDDPPDDETTPVDDDTVTGDAAGSSEDEATPPDDDADSVDAADVADDPSDDSSIASEEAIDVQEDFESYILEMEVTHEGPDGEWTQRLYREADVENDQMYQQFEMKGGEEGPAEFEHYIVEGEAYQILPDGTCMPSDEATIMIHAENPGGFERPHPDEVETDAEHITYDDTTTVAWLNEPVHVWEIDLEPTFEAIDGMIQMYVGVESGYFVGYEGWYTTGAHDDPAEITIEYHRYSFNQDFEIEIPDGCGDE